MLPAPPRAGPFCLQAMTSVPPPGAALDAERITAALPAAARARLAVEVVDEAASTNDLLREAVAGDGCDRVRLARRQTAGRGRRGRAWVAAPGAVCLSLLHVHPRRPPPPLPLWAGVFLVERLRGMGLDRPELRWPNDLVYGREKFGGILVESRARAGQVRTVIGVGINAVEVPATDRPATSIARACGAAPDCNRLAATLIEAVADCLARLDAGRLGGLRAYFERYDALRDRDVRLTGLRGACAGRARGVDDAGRLGVETATGLRWFDAADVRLEAP